MIPNSMSRELNLLACKTSTVYECVHTMACLVLESIQGRAQVRISSNNKPTLVATSHQSGFKYESWDMAAILAKGYPTAGQRPFHSWVGGQGPDLVSGLLGHERSCDKNTCSMTCKLTATESY